MDRRMEEVDEGGGRHTDRRLKVWRKRERRKEEWREGKSG